MIKKTVSIVLTAIMLFSFGVTVFAEGTSTYKVSYYTIDMEIEYSDHFTFSNPVDLMVVHDMERVYINAFDLNCLCVGGNYIFKYSENDCAFVSEERGHLVYYKFGAEKALVYHSGTPVTYKMPYSVRYEDGVAWIPFDFGMKMLNMNYYINETGAATCEPYETVFSVSHRILNGDFKFDFAKDIGYDSYNMFKLETGAFIINLFNGILDGEGRCWGTLVTSVFGGNKDFYDGLMATEVCDLFVAPGENEIIKGAQGCYKFPLSIIKGKEAVEDYDKWSDQVVYECISKELKLTEDEKLIYLGKNISEEVKNIAGKTKFSALKNNFSFDKMDAIGLVLDYAAMKLQFDNRSEVAVTALTLYGKETNLNVGGTVRSYARDVQMDDGSMKAAFKRLLKEKWDDVLLGSYKIGFGAIATIGWNIASSTIPYVKNTIDSAKSFSYCQQAVVMQNDTYWILDEHYRRTLSNKNMDEKYLEKLAYECYAYLKFSFIARECAKAYVEKAEGIEDESLKTQMNERLAKRNQTLAEMMAVVSCVEEGGSGHLDNNNGVYGKLLPREMKDYNRNLDESKMIADIQKTGTLIKSSEMEGDPEPVVLITKEQAEEMVRESLNKYMLGLMNTTFKDIYSFKAEDPCNAYVIDLDSEDVFDDNAEYEKEYCYIVTMYVSDRPDAVFCVPTDGTGVYLASGFEDGELAYMDDINLLHFRIGDLFGTLNQLGDILFKELMEEQTGNADTEAAQDSLDLGELVPEYPEYEESQDGAGGDGYGGGAAGGR